MAFDVSGIRYGLFFVFRRKHITSTVMQGLFESAVFVEKVRIEMQKNTIHRQESVYSATNAKRQQRFAYASVTGKFKIFRN